MHHIEQLKMDKEKLEKHLDSVLDTGTYSMKDMEHLGGVAALIRYIEKRIKREEEGKYIPKSSETYSSDIPHAADGEHPRKMPSFMSE